MDDRPRGPLIQKQGFIKRAPSGKFSAFKKWEKKWCVFALSRRNGPVLDFFDDRTMTGSGPGAAIGRLELKATKQVCAAIQCKVPYTFIIVTESKIVSLAALTQAEADSWISCLRRVLAKEGCLQSSEEHQYEVTGNAMTRQEQERQTRARRRPPTPSDSDNEESFVTRVLTVGDEPSAPPPPPPHVRAAENLASVPPALPKRVGASAGKEPLPPPIPLSSRPKLAENDAPILKRDILRNDPLKNVQDVLQNYEESTDTTYEAGDRQAIRNAAHTLDYRDLSVALQRHQQLTESLEPSVPPSVPPSVDQLYSKINKQRKAANDCDVPPRPPVAPRRVNTLARVEHDFSPALSSLQDEAGEGNSSSDDSDGAETLTRAMPAPAVLYSSDNDSEDTYTCMNGFTDSVLEVPSISMQLTRAEAAAEDDEEDRYAAPPVKSSDTGSDMSPLLTPITQTLADSDVVPPTRPPALSPHTPASLKSAQVNHSAASATQDDVYENSRTVRDTGKPKAVPAAAPRRVNTVAGRPTRLANFAAPTPSKRETVAYFAASSQADNDEQDAYENFLGEFGMGVSSVTSNARNVPAQQSIGVSFSRGAGVATRPLSQIQSQPPNPSSAAPPGKLPPKTVQSSPSDSSLVPPLPIIPGTNSSKRPPANTTTVAAADNMTQSSPKPDIIAHIDIDIPLADGESSDSGLTSPSKSPPPVASDGPSLPPHSQGKDLRTRLPTSSTSDTKLPSEEAPPPYTPPRILADPNLNLNMDCIAEGEEEPASPKPQRLTTYTQYMQHAVSPVSRNAPHNQEVEPLYDSHPAFDRNARIVTRKETDIDDDITTTKSVKTPASTATTAGNPSSPHTPPGTPPPYSRLRTPAPKATVTYSARSPSELKDLSPAEDIVIRLEDTFPRMQQRKISRRHSHYFDDVVMVSPSSTDKGSSNLSYRASFAVLPSKQRITNSPPATFAQMRETKKVASTDALDPPVAEYDHVIRKKLQTASQRLFISDSSSDASDTVIIRRKPKQIPSEARLRRKSAPPTSLAIKAMVDIAATSSSVPRDVPDKSIKERRNRQPLAGGTLLREGKIFKAPQRDGKPKNLQLKQAQTELLQEEIAHSYGVKVIVWKKDVKYALFVDIMGSVWVAGWNQKERPLLQSIFHVGDKILYVNNEAFSSTTKLLKLIKRSDSETKFEIVLRRMPFGKAYFVHRNLDYEDIGMEVTESSGELVQITKEGLVGCQGLRVNPNKAFGPGQCHWLVTQVNHRTLNLTSSPSEARAKIMAVGKDITFVVQPQDFVELLKKALRSTFGWKDYIVS